MNKKSPLFIKAGKIVNKHDPIRLIAIGCPKDEYDGEVRMILESFKQASNTEELQDSIHKIFVKQFFKEIAGSKENYQKLAIELFKLK